MVIVEAMSFGIPIIATNVGGIIDIITHMENGILVEERSARSIYEAILLLNHDESLRIRISKSGYNSAITKYSLDQWIQRIEDIYLS